MPDPITLAALGTIAVTEGVKFLYGQAGELLKYWRERNKAKESPAAQSKPQPPAVQLPAVFDGQLTAPKVHDEILDRFQGDISTARKELSEYADGVEEVDPKNEHLLKQVDLLRKLLEAVYQQRITFKGEPGRGPSGPTVEGKIDVDEVEGYAAGARVQNVTSGTARGEAHAKRVSQGGVLIGMEVLGNVGGDPQGSGRGLNEATDPHGSSGGIDD